MNLLKYCVSFVKASVLDFKEAMEFRSRGEKMIWLFFFKFHLYAMSSWLDFCKGDGEEPAGSSTKPVSFSVLVHSLRSLFMLWLSVFSLLI